MNNEVRLSNFFIEKTTNLGIEIESLAKYDVYQLCLTLKYYYPTISWRDFELLARHIDNNIDLAYFRSKLLQQRQLLPVLSPVIQNKFKIIDDYILRIPEADLPMVALLMHGDEIISLRHNTQGMLGHAEVNCLVEGQAKLGQKYLTNCELFCNFEPCLMCCGVILQSRIKMLHYADREYHTGAVASQLQVLDNHKINPHTWYAGPYFLGEYVNDLQRFFRECRNKSHAV